MKNVNEHVSIQHFALFVTIAAAIFVGGSGTMIVHHILAAKGSPQAAEEPTANPAADPRLAEALTQLSQVLREFRLQTSPLEAPASESSQRSVATESGDSALAELAIAIRELRQALQLGSGPIAGVNRVSNRQHQGSSTDLPESDLLGAERNAAYTRQHILMSQQDVLDTYGLPDRVSVGGAFNASDGATLIWHYMQDRARQFSIGFFNDRVVWVRSQ